MQQAKTASLEKLAQARESAARARIAALGGVEPDPD